MADAVAVTFTVEEPKEATLKVIKYASVTQSGKDGKWGAGQTNWDTTIAGYKGFVANLLVGSSADVLEPLGQFNFKNTISANRDVTIDTVVYNVKIEAKNLNGAVTIKLSL